MAAAAEAKKLDIIICKSISRFSRNMVDCQQYAKWFRTLGVTIIFEEQNIRTDDPTCDFVLSILAAVAQDESHSISENEKAAYASRFARGEYNLGNNRILGYDCVDGELVPNKDAWIVKEVFRRFIEGESYDCAIVLIGHLNKKEGIKGLYRSLGSIDVVAAARSVLQIERDAENMDIRVVHQIKNSLGPDGSKISFSITEDYGFQWLDSISESCDEKQEVQTLEYKTKTEMACALLKQYLVKGDMASKEIYERLGEAGISRRTIAETKHVLGIQSYRKMRQWYWTLRE